MTEPDFRALCAELLQLELEQPAEYTDWKRRYNAAMARTRTALAQPELQVSPKNCWLDDEPDIWPSPCVFEDPEEVIGNCAYASILHSEGKCKTDCQHYRQPH
jgi:hypothetical protein